MKLTVLLDNNMLFGRHLLSEHGLCFLIEEDGQHFLLDTGYSSVFIDNANSMGIDLCLINTVVLSHGHNDHAWGLNHLIQLHRTSDLVSKPRLVAHPQVFKSRNLGGFEIGMNLSRETLENHFIVDLHADPVWLTERLLFLGEIPRVRPFEKYTCGFCGDEPDTISDDSALVYRTDSGIVILTGCSHSGICNIIDRAIELTGEDRILDIVGGFHLHSAPAALLDNGSSFLAAKQIDCIHPSHCTDLHAKIALSKVVPVCETGVGLVLEY